MAENQDWLLYSTFRYYKILATSRAIAREGIHEMRGKTRQCTGEKEKKLGDRITGIRRY